MAEKKVYYDMSALVAMDSQYLIPLGQRANGKSYQAKKYAIEDAWNYGLKMVYLRRYDRHIKEKAVTYYFADMGPMIRKLTGGKRYAVVAKQGDLYLQGDDERGRPKLFEHIGRYCALNLDTMYKSQVFTSEEVKYKWIIYEEFIPGTTEVYLNKEPTRLQQFVSTVTRHDMCKVVLIGNTLSRVSPYFHEWCLENVVNMQPGTLDLYTMHNEDGTITNIAVEMCNSTGYKSAMFFGKAAKQIKKGQWDVDEYPKLPRSKAWYNSAYKVLVIYHDFKFVMELLTDSMTGTCIVYIYRYEGKRTKISRWLTLVTDENIRHTRILLKEIRPEAMILDCFKLGKVFYSDNLVGTDFNRSIKEFGYNIG